MTRPRYHLILCGLLVMGMGLGNAIHPAFAISSDTTIYENRQDLIFRQEWASEPAYQEAPAPPDVGDIVGNITHYAEPNDTVYTGDDLIPSELLPGMEWVHLQVNLTAIYLWDDHDLFSPGDIFLRYIPNYWIGDPEYNGWLNYQGRYFDTSTYQIESDDEQWYNFSTPITLCDEWTVLSCLYFNVYDYDDGVDDSLGYFGWWYEDPTDIEGTIMVDTWFDEETLGDATLVLNVTILETDPVVTAKDLTELFQPFIIDNDDTDHTSDPDGLFARVIHGYDSEIGMGSFCIQYLYYWSEVWTDGFWGDQFIHYDDYELVQVYLNLTYTGGPMAYRFVFDNHHTYTQSNTEWRDSMEYSIFEWGVDDTDTLTKEVYNSEELRPLLGEKYTAHYRYRNMSEYVDAYCGCYGGVPSLILTVETYNHQFAVGNTGGDLLGQYYIEPYTDNIVEQCYLLVNNSFTGGVHEINGYTVPDYAPFAYDVLQVFTVPYIHSNFDRLMQMAASFQGETQSGGVSLNVEHSINITFYIPVETEIEMANSLDPSDSVEGNFEARLLLDESYMQIDFAFNITLAVDLFFYEDTFSTVIGNTIFVDFANPVLQFLLDSVDFDDSYSFEQEFLAGMLSIEGNLTPQLLGTILNCSVDFHLDEILKHFVPSTTVLVDAFFDDVAFTINPVITGYIDSDLVIGNNREVYRWTETENTLSFSFTAPDLGSLEDFVIQLENFSYGLNFQINWGMSCAFSDLISWILDDIEISLGVWPNLDLNLTPLGGEAPVARYLPDADNNRWVLDDTVPSASFTWNLDTVHIAEEVTFTAETVWGDSPFTYSWEFGDGSAQSSGASVTHKYATAGVYTVSLTVTDKDGDIDTYTSTINVDTTPSSDDTGGGSIPGYTLVALLCISGFAAISLVIIARKRR